MSLNRIKSRRFDNLTLDGKRKSELDRFRTQYKELELSIADTGCKDSARYMAMALTSLEESYHWVKKMMEQNQYSDEFHDNFI